VALYPAAKWRTKQRKEQHRVDRMGWLRAAVLGANDGLVSTASLMVGVAAGQASADTILLTGVAGLVAGAMSMAAGEYVSVHSQSDTESADARREGQELQRDPAGELKELTAIYKSRGVQERVAALVAKQLMQHDALGAHMRDELGVTHIVTARPVQAATVSACSFAVGAVCPLLVALAAPRPYLELCIVSTSLVFLAGMGFAVARVSAVRVLPSVLRVTFWGAAAIAVTAGVGSLFGVAA
jgi:VIT1/CCC1 family predicted Fe2+/Mn2+ transporter